MTREQIERVIELARELRQVAAQAHVTIGVHGCTAEDLLFVRDAGGKVAQPFETDDGRIICSASIADSFLPDGHAVSPSVSFYRTVVPQ